MSDVCEDRQPATGDRKSSGKALISRAGLMEIVDRELVKAGRRNVQVSISCGCDCGCNGMAVGLLDRAGMVAVEAPIHRDGNYEKEIIALVRSLPGTRNVN